MNVADDPPGRCRELVRRLQGQPSEQRRPHVGEPPATLEDHLLTTSALVCCLAADDPERDLLRLAALAHDLPDGSARLEGAGERAQGWAALLRSHGELLDRGELPDLADLDGQARLLALAHMAASARLPIRGRAGFDGHPLADAPAVELVYGGATKVKQYVFESARLPEIRGASVLLDHINRLDLPALWGMEPEPRGDVDRRARQGERYTEARDWFQQRFGHRALDAPECVLYASGGNILALAPAGWGARLAEAIERRYTEETQVAGSVGVSEPFSLLELQYGRRPQDFWIDDARLLAATDPQAAALLARSYGLGDLGADLIGLFGADSVGQDGALGARKGFGELVTVLAAKADQRRAGDGVETGGPRFPPFVELTSHARRCSSCDARPAATQIPQPNVQFFCAACARKRDAGIWAKKGDDAARANERLAWILPWDEWLERRLGREVRRTSADLKQLADAAGPAARGFVGLIYADGNNVGSHIARLSSIDAYRGFARQMLEANEQAVASALAAHLGPGREGVWPFEIITIGGDDVLLFVAADRALEIAAAIARGFGAGMDQTGITLSAGVLIMPDSTPVRFARDLVGQLLKHAKERSRQEDGGATIDFIALKAATMISESIADYRRIAFSRGAAHAGPTLWLTQRPYRLDKLETLLAASRALADARFPRSQLYQLSAIVAQGQQLRAIVDYQYFVARGRQRLGARAAYATFDERVRALCDGDDLAPWRSAQGDQRYDTPLLDLIEIAPFVAPARGAPEEAL